MSTRLRAAVVLAVEVLTAGYVSLLAYVMSTWMVDDTAAARMTELDWYSVAAKRLAFWGVVGVALAWGVHQVNRRWVVAPLGGTRRQSLWAALVLGAGVVLAGALGAIRFVQTKPFM